MKITEANLPDIVEIHQQMVFSLALHMTGDYGIAQEVAQDVFLELFRVPTEFNDGDHLRAWLRRVAVHRSTDARRRRSVRPEAIAEEWRTEFEVPKSSSTSPIPSRTSAKVEELLQSLPETLRVPIILRYQEDMLPTEIAEFLGVPLATVKSNLRRGLSFLRQKAAVVMGDQLR